MKDDVSNLLAAVAQLQSSNLAYVSSLGDKGKEILGKVEWGNIVGNIQLQRDLIDLVNSIKDAIETEIGSVFEYKGQVETEGELPRSARIGDCYNVAETDANYVYNGSSWDKLSESYDFSKYALKSDLQGFATEDELNDLATKAELTELQALYYTKEVVDQLINALSLSVDEKLAGKVDNADLENYYTKTESDGKYLTSHQDISGKANVGDCYTKAESNETHALIETEIGTKADKADVEIQDGNISVIVNRLNTLEDRVSDLNKTNIEPVASETVVNVSDETKDYIVTGEISEKSTIVSKSTSLKEVEIDTAVVNIIASDDVDFKNVQISGTYNKSTQGNAISSIHSDGYISIKDCVISATSYNGIEIGLGTGLVKSVLIDNVDFSGKFSNNAISIFGTQEDAVITISNCHFEDVSNVLRISNRTNTKCTINVINCTCDKWETGNYAGLILFQDYTSTTSALAEENNLFGEGKITLNIQNLIKPDGTKLEIPENIADICGSGNNQILYVYRDKGGLVPYNADKFPVVNVL